MSKFNYRKALGWALLSPLIGAHLFVIFLIAYAIGLGPFMVGVTFAAATFYGVHLIDTKS